MIRVSLLAASLVPALVLAQSNAPVRTTVVGEELVSWRATSITCGGKPVQPVVAPDPLGEARYLSPGGFVGPETVAFSIDASGRPMDVMLLGDDYHDPAGDLGPALAASRFAPAGRTDCLAQFTATHAPWAQAAVADVMRYTIFPGPRRSREAFDRLKPVGSTCFDPPPAVLTRSYPDFTTVPKSQGRLGWSMIGFDLNAGGKPVRVRPVAGSGDAVLTRKSVAAVAQSRFGAGVRQGCLYPYYVAPADLPAPTIPIAKDWRPEGSTCPKDPSWARRPVFSFPPGYNRRQIEGWAVVQYDVASWGEIGNAQVLAAQPARAFGDAALTVLRGARWTRSNGYVGCVDRVRFVIAGPNTGPGGTVQTD